MRFMVASVGYRSSDQIAEVSYKTTRRTFEGVQDLAILCILRQAMIEPELKLAKAPIVEAVIDIDCDMPPAFDLAALEVQAREAIQAQYPKFRSQFLEHHRIEGKGDEVTKHSTKRAIQALQFLHDDEKQ